MKKIFLIPVLIAALAAGNMRAEEPKQVELKASAQQTEIVADGIKPISRTEAYLKAPSVSAEGYAMWEHGSSGDDYKFRLQALPLRYGIVSAGPAFHHFEKSGRDTRDKAGAIVRLQGMPIEGLTLKADTRYLGDLVDGSLTADTRFITVDAKAEYTLDLKKLTIKPSLEAKLGSHFAVGIEGKFSGDPGHPEQKYIGLLFRAKY